MRFDSFELNPLTGIQFKAPLDLSHDANKSCLPPCHMSVAQHAIFRIGGLDTHCILPVSKGGAEDHDPRLPLNKQVKT